LLRGYFRWDDDTPIEGGKITLSIADSGTTEESGFFSLPMGEGKQRRLSLVSADKEIFGVDNPKPPENDARDLVVPVPSRLREVFVPIARPLARIAGSLLEPNVIPTIRSAFDRYLVWDSTIWRTQWPISVMPES